jgi:hypothetical protein
MADVNREGQAPSSSPTFNFAEIMQGAQRGIDQRVQERLKSGEFVRPESFPSTQDRAMDALARQLPSNYLHTGGPTGLIDRGSTGKDFFIGGDNDRGMTMKSPGMSAYTERAEAAGHGIDVEERNIASRLWSDKSPAECNQIEAEYRQRDTFNGNGKIPTPHLDAFLGELSQKIQPLEQQREAQLRQVWQQLPDQTKVAIFRHQEEQKTFQFK